MKPAAAIRAMMYRLVKLQQQESQPTSEADAFSSVSALLLCSCAALMQTAVSAHMWPLMSAFFAVAIVTICLAYQCSRTDDSGTQPHHTGKSTAPFSDPESAETARLTRSAVATFATPDARRGLSDRDHPDQFIVAQKPVAHLACFIAGAIVVAGLTTIALGDFYYTVSKAFGISTETKTTALMIGAALLVLLINHLRVPMRRVIFDRTIGVFWIEQVSLLGLQINRSAQMPIHHIVLIQWRRHQANTNNATAAAQPGLAASDTALELNVVFQNDQCVNIMRGSTYRTIKLNAALLSSFLGVPVQSTDTATEPSQIQ